MIGGHIHFLYKHEGQKGNIDVERSIGNIVNRDNIFTKWRIIQELINSNRIGALSNLLLTDPAESTIRYIK